MMHEYIDNGYYKFMKLLRKLNLCKENPCQKNKQLLAQLKLLQYQAERIEHTRQVYLKEKEFQIIFDLLQGGDLENTVTYLSSGSDEIQNADECLENLPSILSIILDHQQNIANQNGINFKFHIRAEELGLQNTDITILFSNILENAIEAAKYSHASKPFVELRVIRRNNQIYIYCENSMDSNTEMQWWNREQYEITKTVIHQMLTSYHGQAVTRTKHHSMVLEATYRCIENQEIRGKFHAEYCNCG